MCGIAAAIDLGLRPRGLLPVVETMSELIAHRGPDGHGLWERERGGVAFGHRRLSIIDLTTGEQPMTDGDGAWVTYNGEIYNYVEVREVLGERGFRTTSDTEVLLRAYRRWGVDCLAQLRGMFAFALWDESEQTLFCARDRFGIKPLYYAQVDGMLVLASEAKALLPFLPSIETDPEGLQDYLTFQFVLHGKTLFRGVQELLPGHYLVVRDGQVTVRRYWEVQYEPDFDHTERYFSDRLDELVQDSVRLHLRADVPVGSYVSGGLDSSIVAGLAAGQAGYAFQGFTGRFDVGPEFDESRYARDLAAESEFELLEVTITPEDVRTILPDLIYHLDFPVAGPGSIPQYMVSKLAAQHVKVVLGGQGGDEIFGGYARYLIAYFEQCIKAAIEGTARDGNFVVTYESIIPSLSTLREYKPLLREFWREGLFEDLDRRYYRLVDRAPQLAGAIDPGVLRRRVAVRALPPHLPGGQRAQGVVLRLHDPLRLQDAPARTAPDRGPGLDGARAGVSGAVRGSRGGRLRSDHAGRREVQERPAQARPAPVARSRPAPLDRRADRQDGLPRAAASVGGARRPTARLRR